MEDTPASPTPTHEKILVDVEKAAEDVFLVSFEQGGSTFRGALLKVKSWPCPDIPRSSPPSTPLLSLDSSPPQIKDEVADASADALPIVSPATTPSELISETEKKPSSAEKEPGNPDFAAIQHRWSYFEKNPPALPRKNFTSKRERDRLDQVPKLRPRNFLCTKCKFALPGFSRAMAQQNASSASNQVDSDNGASTPDIVVCTSPSHARKGKIPLKRAAVNRPVIYDFAAHNRSSIEPSIMDAMNDIGDVVGRAPMARNIPARHKDKVPVGERRKRRLSMEGLPKLTVIDDQKLGPAAVATILSPPSGENGLKMKIKLSTAASPTPMAEDKTKRRRVRREQEKPATVDEPPQPKQVAESAVLKAEKSADPDADEEDDERPRLMIDDSFANDAADEQAKLTVSADEPNVSVAGPVPAARKKRAAKPTAPPVAPLTNGSIPSALSSPSASVPDPSLDVSPPVARAATRCITKDGRSFGVGDIVWGKLTGYPWWPGRIKHIVVCDDPLLEKTASALMRSSKSLSVLQYQEAQVEWFGQKSSISYIEVNQLSHFVEDFDKKHKPKLRGSYQDAIKAASEAVREANGSGETSHEEEVDEKDIFSELAAMEVAQQGEKTVASSSQPVEASSSSDIYEFDTNDIYGRPSNSNHRQHPANSDPSSLDSVT